MKYSKIIDISWPITPTMTSYKNGNEVKFADLASWEKDKYRKSLITLSTHSGTHVDAPSHFHEHGETFEKLSLSSMVGPCKVLDATHCSEKITKQDLEKQNITQDDIILFKTKNSNLKTDVPFDPNFIYLELSAAQLLADKKIKAVGFDYLGIERHQPGHDTHSILFNNQITIIEGLRLNHVTPGDYFFCCLPLAIQGLEAAPARAVLFI